MNLCLLKSFHWNFVNETYVLDAGIKKQHKTQGIKLSHCLYDIFSSDDNDDDADGSDGGANIYRKHSQHALAANIRKISN